ncbi:hypothetical protein Tco_1520529 [Tanacetum coccineum]
MPEYDHEDLTMNPTQVFSVHNWALKANQPKGPPFTDHMKAISNIDAPVESQAPTTSLKTKMKVPQGKNPGARSGLRRKQSSKHISESKTKASKSKTGQSDKETQSKAQQATGGPTSLRATSEEGAHPQLSSGMSAFIIIEHVYSASFILTLSLHQGMDEGSQNYSLDHIFEGTNPSVLVDKTKSVGDRLKTAHINLDIRSAFLTLDSPHDEPIIVSDESEDEETKRYEDTHATSHDGHEDTSIPHAPSPKSVQIQELMA